MKLMTCPVNGARPVSEFVCWGERRAMPDPAACTDAQWADYVFNRNGAPGTKTEWWCHTPSNTWFLAQRDTEADRVVRTTSDATDDTTIIYYRWADGAEGATDVLSPTNSVKGGHICWEVLGAEHPASSRPQVSSVSVGTTSADTATGNSVAPVIPPRDTLYLTMAAGGGEVGAYTAAPGSYANLVTANSGTGGTPASNCFMGGASRQILPSTSDDPGVFTHGGHIGGWTAYTVAIAEAHVFPRHPATVFQNPAAV